MKTLLLLRHAKALRDPVDDDASRALAPEGLLAATRLGQFLGAAGVVPTTLLTSPARRARETLATVAASAGWQEPQQVGPFYEATVPAVLSELRRLPAASDRALVVGHEPTWSETVSRLIGGGTVRLSTASLACIGLDLEGWGELTRGHGRLLWLLSPKLLVERPPDIAAG